jgi:hypothetical protein
MSEAGVEYCDFRGCEAPAEGIWLLAVVGREDDPEDFNFCGAHEWTLLDELRAELEAEDVEYSISQWGALNLPSA